MNTPPVQKVSAAELRQRFNDGRYWERMQAGEFNLILVQERHPSPWRSGQPTCTRSQIIAYVDKRGHRVALVHQYLRTDGTLGGSGRPDPKRLLEGGVLCVVMEAG